MTTNLPGPYSVDFVYATGISGLTINHHLELSCAVIGTPAVGATPGSIAVQTKSGASLALLTAVNDVWGIFRQGLASAGVVCQGWTLWRYVPGTLARDFITAGVVTTPLGASGVAPVPAAQTKCTLRSANGGILQVNMLESSVSGVSSSPLVPAGTGAWQVVMAQYLLSASGWVIARDDSYPVAALNVSFGQNEALFNKRYRNF